MIQIWIHIKDLQPTEKTSENTYKPDSGLTKEGWTRESITKSIADKGHPTYALNVDSKGNIENGNERYWVCRELYEAGDKRFEYLPVNVITFSGMIALPNGKAPMSKVAISRSPHLDDSHIETIPVSKFFHELPIGFNPDGESNPARHKKWLMDQQIHSHRLYADSRILD